METTLLEIAKYTVPSVISLAAALLMVRLFLKKEEDYKKFEITIKNKNTTLPLRLQSYERLTLLIERMEPNNLLTRILPSDISAKDYQLMLISTIKSEFDHNLSQQIYVSANLWSAIVAVRNDMLKNIHIVAAGIPTDASASQLCKAILNQYYEMENPAPHLAAQELLREEVKSLF